MPGKQLIQLHQAYDTSLSEWSRTISFSMNGIFSSTSEMFYILSRVSVFGIYLGVRGAGGLLFHVPQHFICFWWCSHIHFHVLMVILVCLGAGLEVGNNFVFWGKYKDYSIFYGRGHKCAEVWWWATALCISDAATTATAALWF